MTARLVAFVIWAAVAASAVFWALRLTVRSPVAPAHTTAVPVGTAPRGDLTRLFGAAPVEPGATPLAPELASRFRLLGVAAPTRNGDRMGLALIATDGKPARSYAVGAAIDGEMVLQAVHMRGAKLGPRGAATQVELELPRQPLPATGQLPAAGNAIGRPAAPTPPIASQQVGVEGALVPPPPGFEVPANPSLPVQPSPAR